MDPTSNVNFDLLQALLQLIGMAGMQTYSD